MVEGRTELGVVQEEVDARWEGDWGVEANEAELIAARYATDSRTRAWNQQKFSCSRTFCRLEVRTDKKRLYNVWTRDCRYGKGEEISQAEGFRDIF